MMLLLTGCYDDFLQYAEVGEGMAEISAEVTFEPLTGINTETRTSGQPVKDIESLSVIVYTPKGDKDELVKVYNLKSWTPGTNEDMPKDKDKQPIGDKAEASTVKASFTLPSMPYGKYKMYAVANMGDISDEQAEDINNLKKTELEWKEDISLNNKMFGYFTYSDNQDGGAAGFDAPVLIINNEARSKSLHSWIKRTVSKVTVAFDPKDLKQDVWIYIHDVSIRDIPMYCKLGEDNKPNSTDELLNHYDVPLSEIPESSKIIYSYDDTGNLIEGVEDDYQDFKSDEIPESVYKSWLTLAKGSGIKGSDHSETANALYFFENMQGDFEATKEHDKVVDKVDQIDGECITSPGQKGYKNGVLNGTYIEVTGYYVSQNIENTTQGKIKYRFMLGKNATYNFNAQRNHHYKITLGFDGWANQPKWNIEYYEEEPGIEVPDQFYVSYLYNQRHVMPIKIVGNCTNLKMEIVENNWAPYDPSTDDEVPPATVGTGDAAFKWNKDAWTAMYQPSFNKTEFGFLALALPVNSGEIPKNIIDHEWSEKPDSFEDNTTTAARAEYWQAQLKTYYDTNNNVSDWNTGSQRVREFTADQLDTLGTLGSYKGKGTYYRQSENEIGYNGWQVHRVDDESKMLLVPLFTRNKSMINSTGFSGNNPYDSYQRKAVVRITAHFELKDGGTKDIEKDVPVFQVRRIVNPKGVWRQATTSNSTFDVKLLQIKDVSNINAPDYFSELPSEGAWKAYVDVDNGNSFLELEAKGKSYKVTGVPDTVYGNTDDPIEFRLKFNGVDEKISGCAVVKVLYHGNNCMHKILVRQGINEPLAVVMNGAEWSSFSLYSCKNGATDVSESVIEAEFTESPLALGTLFRRHNTLQGIRIINNESSFDWNGSTIAGRGPLVAPNGYQFVLTDGTRKAWYNSTYGTPGNSNTYVIARIPQYTSNTSTDNTTSWGKFKATVSGNTRNYKLPSYDDFKALDNADFGVGVLYGDNSTAVQVTYDGAYGYNAPNNIFTGTNTYKGARGMLLYNKENGNQLFFPMGKDGMGRRTQFEVPDNNSIYYGMLRYGDLSRVLNLTNDYYRPVPYNLPECPGAIYWLDITKRSGYANSSPCAGWDMNYFIVDFGPYPDNSSARFADARPIKMVVDK